MTTPTPSPEPTPTRPAAAVDEVREMLPQGRIAKIRAFLNLIWAYATSRSKL